MLDKCIKEGNPIVEALGNGIQHIEIRRSKSPEDFYALYPTDYYKNKHPRGDCFKDDFKEWSLENLETIEKDNKRLIKYFVKVEDVFTTSSKDIQYLSKFHIWTDNHVREYLKDRFDNNKEYYVWFERVYKLKEPIFISSGGGNIHAKLKGEISIDDAVPIISDDKFFEIQNKFDSIKNKLNNNYSFNNLLNEDNDVEDDYSLICDSSMINENYGENNEFDDNFNSSEKNTYLINSNKFNQKTNIYFKEYSPVVEALGNGYQTILIKSNKPSPYEKSFVLYPIYCENDNLNLTFKNEYYNFALDNLVSNEELKIPIKYYATVEYVIEEKNIPISYFNDFHILTDMHIYNYLNDNDYYIWLLRVYKIRNTQFVSTTENDYQEDNMSISIENIEPVLSDEDFKKIKEKFVSIEFNKDLNDKLDRILYNQNEFSKHF